MSASRSEQAEVVRLKELLFREERHSLDAIRHIVEQHHERIGTDERLTNTVSEVLAESFKAADIRDHRELAGAVSPLVVSSIKREIVNSRDEMVEALYPIMGRLVSAYVSAAMRDVMESTNQRLESGLSLRFIRLRAKSLFSGRPYRELAMLESGNPRVRELLLIKRSSGVLVDRWLAPGEPVEPAGGSGQLIGGLLSAINDFARQAFAGGKDELRSLDIGGSRLFLRSSAAHILAVRSTGTTGRRVQRAIDNALVDILGTHANVLIDSEEPGAKSEIRTILPATAERLGEVLDSERRKPVLAFALVTLLGLGIASAAGWYAFDKFKTEALRNRVSGVVAKDEAFAGYPIEIAIAAGRETVGLSGLAPSQKDAERLTARIGAAIAPVALESHFAVVTNERALHSALDEQAALTKRLQALDESLTRFAGQGDLQAVADLIPDLTARVEALDAKLKTAAAKPDVERISGDVIDLDGQVRHLAEAIGSLSSKTDTARLSSEISKLKQVVDGLPSKADLGTVYAKVESVEPDIAEIRKRLSDPLPRLLQRLETDAVFYGSGTALLNPEGAKTFAQDVAQMAIAAGVDLRVIGNTDSQGTLEQNRLLGNQRAQIVADLLVAAGFPRQRIVLVSRPDGPRISDFGAADGRSDRRADIEIAYRGERSLNGGGRP
ncbi:MAG: OmpA family protein [Hyphomicrobiaceae bacterium]